MHQVYLIFNLVNLNILLSLFSISLLLIYHPPSIFIISTIILIILIIINLFIIIIYLLVILNYLIIIQLFSSEIIYKLSQLNSHSYKIYQQIH